MKVFSSLSLILLVLLMNGCKVGSSDKKGQEAEKQQTDDRLANPSTKATLWVQNASEYKALALQSYATARHMLPLGIRDSSWTASLKQEQEGGFSELPPAVILDVDETVLDNSPFQARLVKNGNSYNKERWQKWAREAKADAIPGALVFTQKAQENGIEVFYLTNRSHEVEEATRENLKRLGFPVSDSIDNLLTKGEQPGWTSSKLERRKKIRADYRIMMMIGDNLNDFLSAKKISEQARDSLVQTHRLKWGKSWFMLPNPIYGSWEKAMFHGQEDAEEEEVWLEHLDAKE